MRLTEECGGRNTLQFPILTQPFHKPRLINELEKNIHTENKKKKMGLIILKLVCC